MPVVKESRQVVRKFLARPQHEGVGAVVRRSIGRYCFLFCLFRISCFKKWGSVFVYKD